MRTDTEEKSIDDKLRELYNMSLGFAYVDDDCIEVIDTSKLYGKKIADIVWSSVDGLFAKYIDNMINGRCSLRASIDFDLGEIEKQIDDRIKILKQAIKKEGQL